MRDVLKRESGSPPQSEKWQKRSCGMLPLYQENVIAVSTDLGSCRGTAEIDTYQEVTSL